MTDPDKPRPWEHVTKGARPCCAALEKRKRKLGVHVKKKKNRVKVILELGGMTKNLYHGIFLNYTGFTVYDGINFFHA